MKLYNVVNVVVNAVCTQDGEYLFSWSDAMVKPTHHDAWASIMGYFFINKDEEMITDERYEGERIAMVRTENIEDTSLVTEYTVTVQEEVLVLPD